MSLCMPTITDMNVQTVDLNSLRALDALLEMSSVTLAAARLGITQPAASASLRRLRTLFDDPLLVRSGRSMVRSSRGEQLLVETRAFLAAAERVLTPTSSWSPSTFTWTPRISATEHVASLLLGPLDASLRHDAPGVDVQLQLPDHDPLLGLVRGEVDLLLGPFSSRRADVHVEPLYDESLALVVRTGHRLATGTPSVADVAAMEHVQVMAGTYEPDPVDLAMSSLHRTRRVTRRVTTAWLAAMLVTTSDLVAVLPRSIALTFSASMPVEVRDVPMDLAPVRVNAVWHDRVTDDPRFRWLLGEIRRLAR